MLSSEGPAEWQCDLAVTRLESEYAFFEFDQRGERIGSDDLPLED